MFRWYLIPGWITFLSRSNALDLSGIVVFYDQINKLTAI
jgi:hypothetical protein